MKAKRRNGPWKCIRHEPANAPTIHVTTIGDPHRDTLTGGIHPNREKTIPLLDRLQPTRLQMKKPFSSPNYEDPTCWVYLARCSDGSLYCGVSRYVDQRLTQHNQGKGAKYTRSRRPVELVYTEKCKNKSEALKREAAIKRMSRQEKLNLIQQEPS